MTLAPPQVHLWTRHEFNTIAEAGVLAGKRVELVAGRVIEMSPMLPRHATGIALAARTLERVFGGGYYVRWQMPLALDEYSEPEPDIAVVEGDVRDYLDDHPMTALLVVEVAESSLAYDQGEKASLYAEAGLEDYWILDLSHRRLEVRRDPAPDPSQPYGFGYQRIQSYRVGDSVSPLARPDVQIAVADLLP